MRRIVVIVAAFLALAPRAAAGQTPAGLPPSGQAPGDASAIDRIAERLAAILAPGATLSIAAIAPALPAACVLRRVSPSRPLVASGRMALRLEGRGCPRWVWADLQLRPPPAPPAMPGPAAGTRVRVVVRVGALSIEEGGRLVPCSRNRSCAVVPSGKHLEGRLEDDTLVVENP